MKFWSKQLLRNYCKYDLKQPRDLHIPKFSQMGWLEGGEDGRRTVREGDGMGRVRKEDERRRKGREMRGKRKGGEWGI